MTNTIKMATVAISILFVFGHNVGNAQKGFTSFSRPQKVGSALSWQPALLHAAINYNNWQRKATPTLKPFTPTTAQSLPTPATTAVSTMAMVRPLSAPVFPTITTQLEFRATERFQQTENNLQKKLREARKALEKQLSFERSTSTSMKNFKLNN